MRSLIAALTLVLFAATAPPSVAGDLEDGVAAFGAGDFQKALRRSQPLAGQGHALAQVIRPGVPPEAEPAAGIPLRPGDTFQDCAE